MRGAAFSADPYLEHVPLWADFSILVPHPIPPRGKDNPPAVRYNAVDMYP